MSALRTTAVAAVFAAMTVPAHAAQVMEKVWFPDGYITWRTEDFSGGLRPGVTDALTYFQQRTPLRFVENKADGNLTIRLQKGLFDGVYGGMTKGYRTQNKKDKLIRISSELSSASSVRDTLLHEMGHALGFTHEFQRQDRDKHGVKICASCSLDPFNFDKVGDGKATILTPYDFESQFATGYQKVTPQPRPPSGALLSKHDINAIYRVYGKALDTTLLPTDDFGVAMTTGDYDGDSIEDVAVASLKLINATTAKVFVNFFKGVETNPDDDDTGTSYMPWFRDQAGTVEDSYFKVALASGDLKKKIGSSSVISGTDKIDEVILGLPGADGRVGEVVILVVNVEDRFMSDDMPWGGKGVFSRITVVPGDVGLSATGKHKFGEALVVANLSDGDVDDLVVGAPGTSQSDHSRGTRDAGSVVYIPEANNNKAIVMSNPSGVMPSRYGEALTVVPRLWEHGKTDVDALVVGAPGEEVSDKEGIGAFWVYRKAIDDSGNPIEPRGLRKTTESGNAGSRLGASMVGFLTNQGNHSWFPKHFLAVGHPGRDYKDHTGGTVWLYELTPDGGFTDVARKGITTKQDGAEFGAALAVHGASCRAGDQCAKGHVWLAIGAPGADVGKIKKAGAAYVWDIWSGVGDVNSAGLFRVGSGSPQSGYGSALATLRMQDSRGGFVVGAPDNYIIANSQPITAGNATVVFNTVLGGTSWSNWTRVLAETTTGDQLPKNR